MSLVFSLFFCSLRVLVLESHFHCTPVNPRHAPANSMDELSLRDANHSSNQGKHPCPLQSTPRFYFPPTPGACPNSPYPLGDHSATTTVPATPDINDSPWLFSYDTVRPMSFTDLLKTPLNVYGGPTESESVRLPLSLPGGATTVSGEQVTVLITPCGGGINPQEMRSVGLPMEGLHQATVGVGGTAANSARDAPTLDRLSGLSTAAGDSLQVRNTEAVERTRDSLTPDTCLSGLSTGARGPPQVHNTEAVDRTRGPLTPDPRVSGLSTGAGGPLQRKAATEQRRVKQQAIANAVAELLEEQEVRINEIAKAHSVLPEKVRLLITRETHYRKRHEESLANALVHIKAHQVNADLPCGNNPHVNTWDVE
ncbi:hypothetical protein EDD15DRAFT_2199557 [Pisolithus albus]|nr:hypothetical protein EDD15DRAFT_2199557 [Pisolithus albus]